MTAIQYRVRRDDGLWGALLTLSWNAALAEAPDAE